MRQRALAFTAVLVAACADGVPVEPPAATPQVEAAQSPAAEETPAEPEHQPDGRLELDPLSEDQQTKLRQAPAPRVGMHRPLPQPLPGVWSSDQDGPVWRLTLRSPGAVAIRLHFTEFNIGDGALLISEPDISEPEEKRRPLHERRYGDAGPAHDGEFWTDLLEGDAVVVEFRPSGARPETLPFRLEEISHLWRSPLDAF